MENKREIEVGDIELTFYVDGVDNTIMLSPIQIFIIKKILGLKFYDNSEVVGIADHSLDFLCKAKFNPLSTRELSLEEVKERMAEIIAAMK